MHLEHCKSTILREMLWEGGGGRSCLGTYVRIKDFKIKKKMHSFKNGHAQ